MQEFNVATSSLNKGFPTTWPAGHARAPCMPATIGALRESSPQETRVSLVPEVAEKFAQTGARVLLEHGAGVRAQFPDSLYKSVVWADSAAAVLAEADVVLTVQPLTVEQIQRLKTGAVVVGFMQPHAKAT